MKFKVTILLIILFNYCSAQNIIEATKRYALNKIFDYDPAYIKKHKIKSISGNALMSAET